MFTLTRKGLWAHKVRFLLTGLAVILGVSFMAGTMILTDTMGKTFDGLFAASYDETDAVVYCDNVLVPWERVFTYNRVDTARGLHPGDDVQVLEPGVAQGALDQADLFRRLDLGNDDAGERRRAALGDVGGEPLGRDRVHPHVDRE